MFMQKIIILFANLGGWDTNKYKYPKKNTNNNTNTNIIFMQKSHHIVCKPWWVGGACAAI